jgi:hypothetical protein
MKTAIIALFFMFVLSSSSYAEEPELKQIIGPKTSLNWISENAPQEIIVSDLIDIIFKNGYFLGLPGKIEEAKESQRNAYQGMCNGFILYISEKIYKQETKQDKFGRVEVWEEEISPSDVLIVKDIDIIYCGAPQKSITRTEEVPKDDAPTIIYK